MTRTSVPDRPTLRDRSGTPLARLLLCALLFGLFGIDTTPTSADDGAGGSLVSGLCGEAGGDTGAALAVLPSPPVVVHDPIAELAIPTAPDAAASRASAFDAFWRKTGPPLLLS